MIDESELSVVEWNEKGIQRVQQTLDSMKDIIFRSDNAAEFKFELKDDHEKYIDDVGVERSRRVRAIFTTTIEIYF